MRAIDGTSGGSAHSLIPPMPPAWSSKWPLLVVALLGGHVLILVAVVMVATRDPSFAVVPNYYENAVAWDQQQAEKRESAKLGWQLKVTPADEVDLLNRRAITFMLTDASGAGVAGASLDVTCFHHSHATRPIRFSATTAADGQVTQWLTVRHAGFWDFACQAVAADGRKYVETVTLFVNPAMRSDELAKDMPR